MSTVWLSMTSSDASGLGRKLKPTRAVANRKGTTRRAFMCDARHLLEAQSSYEKKLKASL